MTSTFLQVLPSVVRVHDTQMEIDFDFAEHVKAYLDNFDYVTVACPLTEGSGPSGYGYLRRCRPVSDLPGRDRLRVIPLPTFSGLSEFLAHYRTVERLLMEEIKKADYLLFCPHSPYGDWPTVATRIALKLKKSYVIDADVVLDDPARIVEPVAWKRFIKKYVFLSLFRRRYRYFLLNSNLTLLSGKSTYQTYSRFAKNAHMEYAITSYAGYITEDEVLAKVAGLNETRALRICYVGRAEAMKGPMDWIETLGRLKESGVGFRATWLGDGALLPEMRSMVERVGIKDYVEFPGYVSDWEKVSQTVKDSDIFLFCHKTGESARCLTEALVSGCPIVGYASEYPEDIVARFGGGQFAPLGDTGALSGIVEGLDKDREKLRELIRGASKSGRLYDQNAAMQHRIDLIKKFL